jgi:hypothetical protein
MMMQRRKICDWLTADEKAYLVRTVKKKDVKMERFESSSARIPLVLSLYDILDNEYRSYTNT